MNPPETKRIRARDVRPYRWAVWCTVEGRYGKDGKLEPFANEIEARWWSEDRKHIWFGLGTHNFLKAEPNEELDLIPVVPHGPSEWQAEFDAEDDARMAQQPIEQECRYCHGKGRILVTPNDDPLGHIFGSKGDKS